jgi:hypothetical protein
MLNAAIVFPSFYFFYILLYKNITVYFYLAFSFFEVLGFEPPESLHPPFFLKGFFLINYLPQLASNPDPPNLCLLSN